MQEGGQNNCQTPHMITQKADLAHHNKEAKTMNNPATYARSHPQSVELPPHTYRYVSQ
jgi:hypothetical protein